MKKILIIFTLWLSVAFTTSAQDTTKHTIVTSFTLDNKNFWRGNVYGNNAPMFAGTLGLTLNNGFELGATGTSTISGNRDGYGIWMELYASQTIGKFKLTVDDYYFFNAYDSLNDYGNWGKSNTQHLIEGRVKYFGERYNITASYVLYAATGSVNNLYLEAEYFLIRDMLSVSAGGVLGESYLNFFDKGGVTFVGFTGYRTLEVTDKFNIPMFASLMISPNYKNASKYPAFSQNLINLIVGLTI